MNNVVPKIPYNRKKNEFSITRLNILGKALIKEFMVIFKPSFLEINLKGLSILVNRKVFIMLIFWLDNPNEDTLAPIIIKKSRTFQGFLK